MTEKAFHALEAANMGRDEVFTIETYLEKDFKKLKKLWPAGLESETLSRLEASLSSGNQRDWYGITADELPNVAEELDSYFQVQCAAPASHSIEGMLHPLVVKSSYTQFRNGQYRDAVLNAVVAVFDLIRERTGLDKDGAELVGAALSLDKPMLVLSLLETESGRNEQKGFIQILQGTYQGIRNPKAHSLWSDLNELTASQYLVFASLLVRRVEESRIPKAKIAARPNQTRQRKATQRMSVRIRDNSIVVAFADSASEWLLPPREDKEGIRRVRDAAVGFATACGATLGQRNAVKKALTDTGYYVSR
jgi:uncharacterized protein (TIGR02391 family)